MKKIRWPDEWTAEEDEKSRDLLSDFTVGVISRQELISRLLKIATSSPPRRKIEPGTLVHVGDNILGWRCGGERVGYYMRRRNDGCHEINTGYYKYARPVAPGWKPGDELTPPNEGDL